MNKHIVSILTLGAVLGGSIAPALAISTEAGVKVRADILENRQERKDDRKEVRDQKQEDRDALRLKLEAKKATERKDRLMKFWKKSGERLQKLIDREMSMSKKIAERLAKFKAAGKDTSRPEALLATANVSIAAAQTALTNAKVTIQAMVTAQASHADITAKTRELHKDVTAKIRVAHKSLVDVIVATRGMSTKPAPSVSPTP